MSDEPQVRSTREPVWLVLVVLLAAFLRLWNLAGEELWKEEAEAARLAALPLPELLRHCLQHREYPLYYVLLRGCSILAGDAEDGLRMLSALAGILLVPVLYAFGRRSCGREGALMAGLLAAVSPLGVYYGREVASAAWLTLLFSLNSLCLQRALEAGPRKTSWMLFAAVSAALFCSGPAGLYAIPLNIAHILLLRRAALLGWWMSATLVGLVPLVAVLLGLFLSPPGVALAADAQAAGWGKYPARQVIPRIVAALTPGARMPDFISMKVAGFGDGLSLAAAALLVAVALFSRNRAAGAPLAARALVPAAMFLLPAGGVAAAAYFGDSPMATAGVELVVLPGFLLLLAAGAVRLAPPARALLVGFLLLAAGRTLHGYYAEPARKNEAAPLRELAETLGAGDLVIVAEPARPTAEYYLKRFAPAGGFIFRSYPPDVPPTPREVAAASGSGPFHLEASAVAAIESATEILFRGGRVYLLYTDDERNRPLRAFFRCVFRLTGSESSGGYVLNQIGDPNAPVQVIRVVPKSGAVRLR